MYLKFYLQKKINNKGIKTKSSEMCEMRTNLVHLKFIFSMLCTVTCERIAFVRWDSSFNTWLLKIVIVAFGMF